MRRANTTGVLRLRARRAHREADVPYPRWIRRRVSRRRFYRPVEHARYDPAAACGHGQHATLVPLDAAAGAALPRRAHGPARSWRFADAGARPAVLTGPARR